MPRAVARAWLSREGPGGLCRTAGPRPYLIGSAWGAGARVRPMSGAGWGTGSGMPVPWCASATGGADPSSSACCSVGSGGTSSGWAFGGGADEGGGGEVEEAGEQEEEEGQRAARSGLLTSAADAAFSGWLSALDMRCTSGGAGGKVGAGGGMGKRFGSGLVVC